MNELNIAVESKSAKTLCDLQNMPLPKEYYTITGPLPYRMMNDVLFHVVFEANQEALKDFVCSLLDWKKEDVTDITIMNPFVFGRSVAAKNFILDLKVLLNNSTIMNLEMQVVSMSFWTERSLGYLCRAFDNLNRGNDYHDTKSAIHIGILNFELFHDEKPQFYATFHLANDVTHKIYTDKLRLSVLQLNHAKYATEKDVENNLHLWAEFFQIRTWEELRMFAEKHPLYDKAAKTIFRLSTDEEIRLACEAVEDFERTQRTYTALMEEKEAELQKLDEALQERNVALQEKDAELQEKDAELQEKNAELQERDAEIARLRALLAEKADKK